jgi:hypothetical protein
MIDINSRHKYSSIFLRLIPDCIYLCLMNIKERKSAFVQLGNILSNFTENKAWKNHSCGLTKDEYADFNELILKSKIHNGWFTEENVRKSIEGITLMLQEKKLDKWMESYEFSDSLPKKVGVIMAGNIPLVGFHDALCVLISGNILLAKLSSEDSILFPAIFDFLVSIDPRFKQRIELIFKLENFDAVIATGSDNSARYFESYFGNYPNIIRKNRTSVAVFTGNETTEDLEKFADDVFLYFGKGCRNVTKIYLPIGFDLDKLFGAFYKYKEIINHNKYANNYDYNKAIYLMNQIELVENGFVLLKEDKSLHSPLSVLNYQFFEDETELEFLLNIDSEAIQCVVGENYLSFGKAQKPEVWDYADNVDTLQFLLSLNTQ